MIGARGRAASLQTIFWDVGGVLLTNGWDQTQRARVLGRLGADLPAYEELHDRCNYYWERGLTTAREFFNQTLFDPQPELDLSFEKLWPQVCAESRVLSPECLDLLAELRQDGPFRLATLNNESRELNEYRLDAFKLRGLFDYFICSGYVHEMKPMPGIYRTALGVSGFPSRTALLIDDKEENCAAARTLGMYALKFDSPARLRQDLIEFGVEFT